VIRGSVAPEGDQIAINVRLTDGSSGVDLQRAAFTLPASDFLAMADSVAQEASRFLRESIGDEVRVRRQREATADNDAWVLVQRGEKARKDAQAILNRGDADGALIGFLGADSILELAEAADPQWPDPMVLRSEIAYSVSFLVPVDEADEIVAIGVSHADRAQQRSPDHAGALAWRGRLNYSMWWYRPREDPDEADALLAGAREDLENAVAIDPTLAVAHATLSHLRYVTGDRSGAKLSALRAWEEDAYLGSLNGVLWRLFQTSYDLEQHEDAKRWCDEGRARLPQDRLFVECQLWLYTTRTVIDPDPDEAWSLLAEFEEVTPEPQWPIKQRMGQMFVATALGKAGLVDSAKALLVRSRGNPDVDPFRELLTLEAFIRTLLGDNDEALRLLTEYFVFNPDHRDEMSDDVFWWWRGIQDDPRYQALLAPER
jgi:tetratricopeptide (TPR) repeat protein